jgi:adenylate cyclase
MNYTIMGNAVNIASRLEGINKLYGTWILASEETIKDCGERLLSRRLDRIRVAGLSEPVRIYEPLALAEDAPAVPLPLIERFHTALDLFEKHDWPAAETAFTTVLEQYPHDGPARLYLERCRQYRQTPPPPDWDGVFDFNEK